MRTHLLLMVLIPGVGMSVIAGAASVRSWSESSAASSISDMAARMDELMTARSTIRRESVPALALATAAEFGLEPEEVNALYGVDFVSSLATARAAVDANRLVQRDPSLRPALRAILADRPLIDSGTLSSSEAKQSFDGGLSTIRDRWASTESALRETLGSGSISGEVRERADAVRRSFEAFTAGDRRILLAVELATGVPGASVQDLITADAQLEMASAALWEHVGVRGRAADQAFRSDPAVQRFDAVVRSLIQDGLAGRASPYVTDRRAYGEAFVDSAAWVDRSTRIVAAASADLSAVAAGDATAGSRTFWAIVALGSVLFLLAMTAVAFFSRAMTRPLDRIATVVQSVRDGEFGIPRMPARGPRELAETVEAINEMAASIDESSHDLITGLLDRRAAFDAVARGLARARRAKTAYMALFLDLDGLKRINDTHGHPAGDRAIALVGTALRETCRASDVVARVGGDEFLVAGEVGTDLEAFAAQGERIAAAIASKVLWVDDTPISLSCSFGVGVSAPGSLGVDALIADADAAMYVMKVADRRGRQRAQAA